MPPGGPGLSRSCYAVTAPGMEAITSAELSALGFSPARTPDEPGGVPFDADLAGVFRANLHLRTATRVLMRLADFRATAFHELERHSREVDWGSVVSKGASVAARVTCKKSRLYHSDAVAERVLAAVKRAVPSATVTRARGPDEADAGAEAAGPTVLLTVRFLHDRCTISADTSGALLHRRGHRLATAKAPLRETLAASVLLALGYDGSSPLVDPMCGAGTFALEAALIARKIAPGLTRSFACEAFRDAPRARFEALRAEAHARALPAAPSLIAASDRDEGAIAATRANLARAGVEGDVVVARSALSALFPPETPGLLVVNPPYGERIGDSGPLRNLYAQLGNVVRARCGGWTLGLLSTDRALEAQVKLPFEEVLRFKNGGIAVRLVRARVD